MIIPYLGPGQSAAGLQLAVTVYSDVPLAAAGASGCVMQEEVDVARCWCDKCGGKKSPFQTVVEKLECLEVVMDQRLAFLDGLLAAR